MRTLPSPPPAAGAAVLHAWRHAPARNAAGRCIGRTDLPIDPRRAKRLAHRIRAFARRNGLPRIVVTSPLRRCRATGRWLARWGWQHRVDALLREIDFGHWDGLPWSAIPRAEFDSWCADFAHAAPAGDGEPVAALLQRVRGFDPGPARIVVTHGGWLSAARWLEQDPAPPQHARQWPATPRHGSRCELPLHLFVSPGEGDPRDGMV
ncbi:MAG TPA: histidine phosphatase family protein [Rubrivivax sp.]|nr:histidine phosphatase family protein [Rubrivivax sp.]